MLDVHPSTPPTKPATTFVLQHTRLLIDNLNLAERGSMTTLCATSLLTLAAEPASILYIVTGAVGFIFAGRRRARANSPTSIAMLFCRRSSRRLLEKLNLL